MKRRSSKTNANKDDSAQPTDSKRAKTAAGTTRAQQLRLEASKKQMAKRAAEGKGVFGVPTFSRTAAQQTSNSSSHTSAKSLRLSPVRHNNYNLRQATPPPTRFHPGSKSTSLSNTSNLANRMRAALQPNAVEQTVCCIYSS